MNFLSQLARSLGMTITRMLQEMSSLELAFWEHKHSTEFLGDERFDYGIARIEAAVGNFAGKCLKDEVSLSPLDLMPFYERKEKTAEEIDAEVKLAFAKLEGQRLAAERRAKEQG